MQICAPRGPCALGPHTGQSLARQPQSLAWQPQSLAQQPQTKDLAQQPVSGLSAATYGAKRARARTRARRSLARAAMPNGAIVPAGAIAAAGPDTKAAGPDFDSAGPPRAYSSCREGLRGQVTAVLRLTASRTVS